ncbi:unnamed protein product, partial [Timema podura]|nr:unnamed protein product [Timema podura]
YLAIPVLKDPSSRTEAVGPVYTLSVPQAYIWRVLSALCVFVQVCEDDHLPKSLCYRCMYLLENFYDFRKNCVNSVSLLESCLTDPEGLEVNPELRLEYERLQSQLREVKGRNKKGEVGETDNSMPRLEPQVPVPSVVGRTGRRPSGEPAKRQTHSSSPVVDDSGDYHEEGGNWDVPSLKRR